MRKLCVAIFMIFIINNIIFSVPIELKNILMVEGIVDYPVIGYGVVTGLKGTGDSEKNSAAKEIINLIVNNFGINITNRNIQVRNSAVVIVSAILNPLLNPGNKVDVKVSSVYDAKSLEGGELIVTPLIGENNEIFVVAQGSIICDKNNKGVTGIIPNGGIIKKTVPSEFVISNNTFNLILRENYSLENLFIAAKAIENEIPNSIKEINKNKIIISLPENHNYLEFLNKINNLKVDIQQTPKIIIDSKTGTIIAGGNIVVTEAAITFKNTKLQIGYSSRLSSRIGITNQQTQDNIKYLPESATIQDLVNGLNKIGASNDDIVKIIQLLYRNGNIKAQLEIQ